MHQQLIGVQSTRWVVGVDDHNALGVLGDLRANVFDVRHPTIRFVTHIVHRCAARQTDCSSPQWVIRRRQQHLVTVVEQAIGGHDDEFTRTIAEVNVIERDAFDALLLRLVHHRFAGAKNAFAVRVARRGRQVADHVLLNFFGRIKAKHSQVADVEFDDLVAFLLHLTRSVHDGTANVITDVGQLVGFLDLLQSPSEGSFTG